jgi:hypothetical protein
MFVLRHRDAKALPVAGLLVVLLRVVAVEFPAVVPVVQPPTVVSVVQLPTVVSVVQLPALLPVV